MASDTGTPAGLAFARDLQRIREQNGISLKHLHKVTMIPVEVITLFEETSLIGHPSFNEVYLRSFVREYAKQVDISTKDALGALSLAQSDMYSGQLADKYLKPSAPEPAAASPETQSETSTPQAASAPSPSEPAVPKPEAEPPAQAESKDVSTLETRPTPAAAPLPASTKPLADFFNQKEPPPPFSKPAKPHMLDAQSTGPKQVKLDPASPSPASARRKVDPAYKKPTRINTTTTGPRTSSKAHARQHTPKQSSNAPLILGALLVLALVIVGIWWFFLREAGSNVQTDGSDVNTPAAVMADRAATTPLEPVLGAVMHLDIIAEGGPLLRLLVRRDSADMEARWVEPGDTLFVEARDRILLQNSQSNAIGRATLLLEGKPFPTDPRPDVNRLEITRAAAIAHLESLRQAGQ